MCRGPRCKVILMGNHNNYYEHAVFKFASCARDWLMLVLLLAYTVLPPTALCCTIVRNLFT